MFTILHQNRDGYLKEFVQIYIKKQKNKKIV